jgi:hypothetical protein
VIDNCRLCDAGARRAEILLEAFAQFELVGALVGLPGIGFTSAS